MNYFRHSFFNISYYLATITFVPLIGLLPFGGCTGALFPNPAVRYIAFGDSTTNGPTDRHYWVILAEKLNEKPQAFANEGWGGESSSDGLNRLQNLLNRHFYPNARVLLYWQGGDDVVEFIKTRDPFLAFAPTDPEYPLKEEWNAELDRIQEQIEQAVRIAHENGLEVYIATYYFLRDNLKCKPAVQQILLPPQAENANSYVAQLNDRIRTAARNQNATLVDVGAESETILGNPANYFDCNHLNETGNEIVADLFLKAIRNQSAQAVEKSR